MVEVENWLEHLPAVSFYVELVSSEHRRNLVVTRPISSQLSIKRFKPLRPVFVLDWGLNFAD